MHGDLMSTLRLTPRTWELLENKEPEEAFFFCRTWEYIEKITA
jgi:hypothetical protein